MAEPGYAVAGSRWYRTAQTREIRRWLRGEYAEARVDVVVRWLHGMGDPVIIPTLLRGYPDRFSDFQLKRSMGGGALDHRATIGTCTRQAPRVLHEK